MDGNSVIKSSPSGLPSYNEATSGMFYQTPTRKKKIIPVQSDFESSSPSPEGRESPSPVSTPSRTIRTSQSSVNLAKINQDLQSDRTKKSLGMKLKTSYSKFIKCSPSRPPLHGYHCFNVQVVCQILENMVQAVKIYLQVFSL